jgi:hypothetical protein
MLLPGVILGGSSRRGPATRTLPVGPALAPSGIAPISRPGWRRTGMTNDNEKPAKVRVRRLASFPLSVVGFTVNRQAAKNHSRWEVQRGQSTNP